METTTSKLGAQADPGCAGSIDQACQRDLIDAVQTYFDLMYDCDTSRFDEVFLPTAHLHGFRDGKIVAWSAPTYRTILDERRSPKSLGSPRLEEILMMDFTSPTQAFVKVRVRIVASIFIDDLTWHRIDGRWRITSKSFHREFEGSPDRWEIHRGDDRSSPGAPHVRHESGVAARIGAYSDGVEVQPNARWLISAGTPGLAVDGALASDIAGQAEAAWANVSDILARAGMSFDDLVKVTTTLTRPEDIAAYGKVRANVLGSRRPAFMLMIVPQLVRPEFLVEIEFMAAKA